MFRAPNSYGYITATSIVSNDLDISLSGVYTGSMLIQRFAGYVDKDVAFKTPAFYDIHCRAAYNFRLRDNVTLQLNAGIKNIFNSYQNVFDRGADRDAGFIFGPSLPRTLYIGVKLVL